MKKIMLLIVVILIIGLVGCTPKTDISNKDNENISNENIEQSGDNNEITDENISQNTELSEEELVEKYKLCDSYVLNGTDVKNISFNILDSSYNMETGKYERVANNQEIICDGIKFNIECNKVGTDKDAFISEEYNIYELKINNESLEFLSTVGYIPDGCVGIIDLDPLDEYKEIVIRVGVVDTASYSFYKLTKNGIELIYSCEADSIGATGPLLVNNKYIIPVVSSVVNDNLIFGYYMYEDGEFKFIDRFLTGERITDEKGNFPERFKNQIYSTGLEGSKYCPVYYEGNIVHINGKVKFLKETKLDDISRVYDVEIVEESSIWLGEQQITLPKGTILTYNQE